MTGEEKGRLIADLQAYLKTKNKENGKTADASSISRRRPPRPAAATIEAVETRQPPRLTPVEKVLLSVLSEEPMSPPRLTSEIQKRRNMRLSLKRVGLTVHEMAEKGLVEMVGPSTYRSVA